MNFQTLITVVDDCIEDGKVIAIVCKKELAFLFTAYLDEYDLNALHNVLTNRYAQSSDDYIIMINCKDNNYEYFVDFFIRKPTLIVDEVYAIGQFITDDLKNLKTKYYNIISDIQITEDDIEFIQGCQEDYDVNDDDEDSDDCGFNCKCHCDENDCNCNCECDCPMCTTCNDELDEGNMENMDKNVYIAKIMSELPDDWDNTRKDRVATIAWYYHCIMNNNMCPECLLDLLVEFGKEFELKGIDIGMNIYKDYMLECLANSEVKVNIK